MNFGKRQSQQRWWCAGVGIVALLLQLAVPLGQGLTAAAFGTGQGEARASLVLCTLLSTVSNSAQESGQKPQPDPGRAADFCPVCLARTLSGSLLAAAPVALALPVDWLQIPLAAAGRTLVAGRTPTDRLARAPPQLA
ncbi:MAG: hypothetical protein QF797_11880 [Alphaproteobacteria bacterium]|nr:hypothetical protein [Alphaproteobacteria bacterium]